VPPSAFIEALGGQEELIVSSRADGRERSVRAWYVLIPPATIYLFTYSFALRAARWRKDPWIRLTIPGGPSMEGLVKFVTPAELDEQLMPLLAERWSMWGVTNPEGLRRMLLDGSHILVRVDLA
jgi:hypothetical protein